MKSSAVFSSCCLYISSKFDSVLESDSYIHPSLAGMYQMIFCDVVRDEQDMKLSPGLNWRIQAVSMKQ